MIEIILLNYLNSSGFKAYLEEENDMPEEYLLIQKAGSRSENHIRSATIIIQSYAETMYKAALLNNCMIGCMENAVSLNEISSCKLNSDYIFTDTARKKYRYQAVYDITYY